MDQEQEQLLHRVGANISRIRKERGYSLRVFADMAEIQASNLVPVEQGKQNLTLGTLHKLAKALDCTIFDLLA
jgi:transcriptional regulator with XRE-family HTH domain